MLFTQEVNHIAVEHVENYSHIKFLSKGIYSLILEINYIFVIPVGNHSHGKATLKLM